MPNFARKSPFGGYTGGLERWDKTCTHAILTIREYEDLCDEIRGEEATKNELTSVTNQYDDCIKRISEYRAYCGRLESMIEDLKDQASSRQNQAQADEIARLQQEMKDLSEELDYQKRLNGNLLRISRERANAERKIQGKKAHSGYLVLTSSQKDLQYHLNGSRKLTPVRIWETVLQSPYHCADFAEQDARELMRRDLLNWENPCPFTELLHGLGITCRIEEGYEDASRNREWRFELEKPENNILFGGLTLRADYRTGFWTASFRHTQPIAPPPEAMRPTKRK